MLTPGGRWGDLIKTLVHDHECEHCGKGFDKRSAPQRFCSASCRQMSWLALKTEPQPRQCLSCGVTFEIVRAIGPRRKTCSPACRSEWSKLVAKRPK